MEDGKSCNATGCKCPCHKLVGILIALIGVTFLLGDINVLNPKFVATAWPVLLIFIGIKKSCPKGMCKCCSGATK